MSFFDLRHGAKQEPIQEPFDPFHHYIYREITVPGDKYMCDGCEQEYTGRAYQGVTRQGMARTLCPVCRSQLGKSRRAPEPLKPRKHTLD